MGELKYKLSKGAEAPLKATKEAAGYDCFAYKREFLTVKKGEFTSIQPEEAKQFDLIRYSTGIIAEIPKGHAALTFARSSVSRTPLIMANTTGVIDSDYRGEVIFMFRILESTNIAETAYQVGDRIGQLVLIRLAELELAQAGKLSGSDRASGGYGSTGR